MENLKNNHLPKLIFLLIVFFILWKMLLPGFLLSLDLSFGPEMGLDFGTGKPINDLPIWGIVYFLSKFIPAWVVEKICLSLVLYSSGYFAYKFLFPENFNLTKIQRVIVGVFYMANPFVYTRLLAGQWLQLAGYALLPVAVNSLYNLSRAKTLNAKDLVNNALVCALISFFSLHYFTLSVVFFSVIFIFKVVSATESEGARKEKLFQFFRHLKLGLLAAITLLATSWFWMHDVLFGSVKILYQDPGKIFSLSGHGNIPAWLNVLTLHGFWGESWVWHKQFLWAQETVGFWCVVVLMFLVISFGLKLFYKQEANAEQKNYLKIFASLGLLSLVLAFCGSMLGFRDEHKLVALLVLTYSVFIGFALKGLGSLRKTFSEQSIGVESAVVLVLIVNLVPFIWFGLSNQIKNTDYPAGWYSVKEIVQKDGAVFLPWHGYFSLRFNHNIITANPAKVFFGDNVYMGRSVELGVLQTQYSPPEFVPLDKIFSDGELTVFEVNLLKERYNIKYLVETKDLEDLESPLHIESELFEVAYEDLDIKLMKLK